jgi:hypothetical protein
MKKASHKRLLIIAIIAMATLFSSFILAARLPQDRNENSRWDSSAAKKGGNQMLWDVMSQHFVSAVRL